MLFSFPINTSGALDALDFAALRAAAYVQARHRGSNAKNVTGRGHLKTRL